MTVETTAKTLEYIDQRVVPEYDDSNQLLIQTSQEAATEAMSQPEAYSPGQVITEVISLGNLLRNRQLNARMEYGDQIIDMTRFATRQADGVGLNEIYEFERVTLPSHKQPNFTARITLHTTEGDYRVIADSESSQLSVESLGESNVQLLDKPQQDKVLFEMYARMTRARAAAEERDIDQVPQADRSAKQQLLASSSQFWQNTV